MTRLAFSPARLSPLLLALGLLAACSDDDPVGPLCPTEEAGPALGDFGHHLLVANSLGETWNAVDLDADTLAVHPKAGLTGQAPNDLEVVDGLLYVVNSLDNAVGVIDLASGCALGSIAIGTGANPYELEIDPADSTRAWLTNFLSGELVELDLRARNVVRRTAVGPALQGLWVGETEIAVTLTGFNAITFGYDTGYLVVLDKATLRETARLAVPTNPQFLLRAPDGLLHVVSTGDYGTTSTGRVARVENDWSALRDTLEIGGAPGRATVGGNGTVYLTAFCDGVLSYDGGSFTAIRDAGNPMLPGTCAGDAEAIGAWLFVAAFDRDLVAVIDPADGAVIRELPIGDGPSALVRASVGR